MSLCSIAAKLLLALDTKTPKRIKRKILVEAEESRVWQGNDGKGFGNKEYFTVELSEWLKDHNDVVSIDQLVDFIYSEGHIFIQFNKVYRRKGGKHAVATRKN